MRKGYFIFLAILMALSLAACANPQAGEDSTTPQGTFSPADNSGSEPSETVTEAETEPPELFTHETPLRVLVHNSASRDVQANETVSGTLSAAMVERDAAIEAMWSLKPEYTISNANLLQNVNAGYDNYDICLFQLTEAISNVGMAQDVSGSILHQDSAVWEQGLWSLTFNGKILFAAPSVGVTGNDYTYGVFYDAEADGGALKDKVESIGDGWTWEQMLSMEAESPQLAENGMNWGERALSALFISGGFHLTSDSIEPAEMYMDPIIDYVASGKATIPSVVNGSPFKSANHVFSVGTLNWLYDTKNKTVYDRLTVLPLPRQSTEEAESCTTTFNTCCIFVPYTAKDRQEECVTAMYIFAKATYDKMRTPYLDQLVPASNTVSRINVEKLLANRVYDYALHSNSTWRTTEAKRVRSYISTNRAEYRRAAVTWSDYYTTESHVKTD